MIKYKNEIYTILEVKSVTQIVSFDIWDTLIKRKCHPEEVKLYTLKYLFLKYNNNIKEEHKDIYKLLNLRNEIETELRNESKKNGKDGECKIEEAFDRIQKEIFKEKQKNITDELKKVEIDFEKSVIYVNEEILPILEKYKDAKKYCISDFYMGKDSLKEILDSVDMGKYFEEIFSSADIMLNKVSGRLFKYVEEKLNIKPEEHLHIGDNIYSDIEVPSKQGIKTLEVRKYNNFEFTPEANRKFDFDLNSVKLNNNNNKKDELFNVGVELSPLLYFFVKNIVEYAIKNNMDKIYYQTREGETFIKIHQLLQEENPYAMKLPECELLEVSRVATFGASLEKVSIGELLRLWSQYRAQSMKALFKTLDININNYMNFLAKYDIDPKEVINEPWFNIKIQNLFNNQDFIDKMQEEVKIKNSELKKFFEKKGIFDDDKEIFVIDLGWRGTIQDNIAYIYPNKKIGGYYFALYDYYNYQPKNTYKISFIKNKDIRDNYIGPMITLFEMLFNPESGSVVKYKNGEAIRKVKEEESAIVKNITSHIQRGMLEGAKQINKYLKNHPYLNEEFDEYIYKVIKNLKEKPSKSLIEAYYSLVHNDTFGTGEYIDKKGKLSKLERCNIIKVRNMIRKEPWKEAYIIHNNVRYMDSLMNVKAKIRKIIKG